MLVCPLQFEAKLAQAQDFFTKNVPMCVAVFTAHYATITWLIQGTSQWLIAKS